MNTATRTTKDSIKDAAILMLADIGVMRKSELVVGLENHMTTTERGKHFFEVRESIIELIAEGAVKSLEYTLAAGFKPMLLLALPSVEFRPVVN